MSAPSASSSSDPGRELSGVVAVVTGANSGLGCVVTRELARHGARVIMACRSGERGRAAVEAIRADHPDADLVLRRVDLADLDGVRGFAAEVVDETARLDLLVNNAGIMAIPRATSAQGHEMQFAVNHLAHFVLTARLRDRLLATPDSRIVHVSSIAAHAAGMKWTDLDLERGYGRYRAYGQSKLANVLFGRELARRLGAIGSATRSIIAHPGYTATSLQSGSVAASGSRIERLLYAAGRIVAQSPEAGARPLLHAALAPEAVNGGFYGPKSWFGLRGDPTEVALPRRARTDEAGRRLWEASERMTGERFEIGAADHQSAVATD